MIRDDEMVADGGRRQEWVTRNKKKKMSAGMKTRLVAFREKKSELDVDDVMIMRHISMRSKSKLG